MKTHDEILGTNWSHEGAKMRQWLVELLAARDAEHEAEKDLCRRAEAETASTLWEVQKVFHAAGLDPTHSVVENAAALRDRVAVLEAECKAWRHFDGFNHQDQNPCYVAARHGAWVAVTDAVAATDAAKATTKEPAND